LLAAARLTSLESMRSEITGREVNTSSPKLLRYLKASMAALPEERLRVLFLDPSRRLLADEQLQQGSLGQLAMYPRTVFRRAFELDAAAIILVHNHPSGDPRPSQSDVDATERMAAIGRALDVELLEHIVVAVGGHRAIMREGKMGRSLSQDFVLRSPADWQRSPDRRQALANAQRISRRRLLRRQLVVAEQLFGDPAWDMLLDLFIHEADGRPVSTSSICIASGLPMTSALRLLQKLCDADLVTREADHSDGRRNFIRLAPDLGHRLLAYFAAGDE
jgi:DNA repair protein RadC